MRVLFLCLGLALAGHLVAQSNFTASASSRQVAVGDFFEVTFTLANADGADFKAPAFPNCRILSGPNQYTSTKIINGNISRLSAISYRLIPLKVGKLRIESASIIAYRQKLVTQPLIIEVTPEDTRAIPPPPNTSDKDMFIRAEPSVKEAYVGQQVAINFKIYTSVDLTSITPISEPNFAGFFREDIASIGDDMRRVSIGGRNYISKTIKRVALFPQQEGEFNIETLRLQVGVKDTRTGMLVPKTIGSAPIKIKVLPLPSGAPSSFSGAVGSFDMTASLSTASASTDDALTLTIGLGGDGDIHRVQPPNIVWPPAIEVYDPKIADDQTFERQGMLQGQKKIEYTILPKQVGVFQLKPAFSYFDPFQRKYITLSPSVPELKVTQGTQKSQAEAASANKLGSFLPDKLISDFSSSSQPFFSSTWFFMLLGVPILGLCVALGYKRLLWLRSRMDITLVRRKRAGGAAQKRLDAAKVHLNPTADVRKFCQAVSNALYGYVGDKLNIPPATFTKENIKEKLTSNGASDTSAEGVLRLLTDCELAIFAGQGNTLDRQAMLQRTEDIIDSLERELVISGT